MANVNNATLKAAVLAAISDAKLLDAAGLKYFRQKNDARYILANQKGAHNGVATLDANGKITPEQIPGGLDDYIQVATLPTKDMLEDVFYYVATGGDDDDTIVLGQAGHTYRWLPATGEGDAAIAAHWVDIGSVDTANKALKDADGNVISTTYVKKQGYVAYSQGEKDKLAGLLNIKALGAGVSIDEKTGTLTATGTVVDLSPYIKTADADKKYATLTGLDGKVDKVEGKGLSSNDYTTAEKNKLAGLNNYTLPIAGNNLGGVKNGGNVVIGTDGTANVTLPDIQTMTNEEIDAAFAD